MSRARLFTRARPKPPWPVASAALALLGGCGRAPQGQPASRPSDSRPSDSRPSASSPADLLSQAWASWQRAQGAPAYKPNPSPKLALRAPEALRPAQLSRIDLSPRLGALAGGVSLLAPGSVAAPSGSTAAAGGAFVGGGDLWSRALQGFGTGSLGGDFSSPGGVSSNWSPLQSAMGDRQVRAVQDLALRVAAQRQAAALEREGLLRDDLRDDLERVGRVDIGGIVPALPPSERLARLTNLRLKLLEVLAVPASEQERARAEIARIQNEIRALLREQEVERAELLGRLRREVPARLRAQREADIRRILEQSDEADSLAINALLTEQKRRAQIDFSLPARLALPASGGASGAGTGASSGLAGVDRNQFRTFAAASPSSGAIPLPQVRPQVLAAPPERSGGLGSDSPPGSSSAPSGTQQGAWKRLLQKRARAWSAPLQRTPQPTTPAQR